MSTIPRYWAALFVFCLTGTLPLLAQDAATDSVRLSQPIPVTIRMSNNAVVKTMLLGMDQDSITTMNLQGRTVDYLFTKVRSVRSNDGSIFFTPAKDSAEDLIARLIKLQPAAGAAGPGSTGVGFTGMAGGHGQMPQPGFTGPSSNQMAGHNQAHSPTYNPPAPTTMPSNSHSHMASNSNSHSQMASNSHAHMSSPPSFAPPPMHMPMHNQPHSPPSGPGPQMMNHNQMGQQMVWQYTCTKCQYQFTSATEVQAGHKCARCGVVWGEIVDQNTGKTLSSSPAAKFGGGVGGLILVILIIVGIVRKAQSS